MYFVYYSFNVFSQCSEATVYLVKSFKERINHSNNSKTLVTLSVSLFIHILYKVMKYGDEETEDQKGLCEYLRECVQVLLKFWVVHGEVIGGSFFGGELRNYGSFKMLIKEEAELKVC